ncbi:hypothetical protein [Mycolicibacterium sp. YH-1]|uniref:hypothetical protein n=1 Tax=Mycolicibacterium sp. YH-1 TaxID=2908837 RepID=UPI001F4C1ED0|nr:hypothetical protein [Mycolicibacterium sp. YH-1]UNB52987.1 hypothetical protein L0M16_00970 [Mycolicibacterium sp. YH-1]
MATKRWVSGSAAVLLCGAFIASMTGCTVARVVAGAPTSPPPPTHGHVEVTLALMDSFDVVTAAKCAGRRDNDGVHEGAIAEVRGLSDRRRFSLQQVTSATVSTSYVQNDFDQSVDGDGKYCLARFSFVPPKPDPRGYRITFPASKAPGPDTELWSFYSDVRGGRGYGSFHLWAQTCPDFDAPPERLC